MVNPDGRPTTMPEAWARLADAAGGVAPLAEALGVTTMTLWRWSKGGKMSRTARMVLETFCKRRRLPIPEVSDA